MQGQAREHYNRQSRLAPGEGTSAVRKACNMAKGRLVAAFAPGGVVLDLGGGRGGDFPKYLHARTRAVVHVDVAEDALQVARGRVPRGLSVKLVHGDMLEAVLEEGASCFTGVSSAFSLHYLDPRALPTFAAGVARALAPCGVWFGITCTAEGVARCQASSEWEAQANGELRCGPAALCPLGDGSHAFTLDGSVDACRETPIGEEALRVAAGEAGLDPLFVVPLAELDSLVSAPAGRWPAPPLSPCEQAVLLLYSAFAFRRPPPLFAPHWTRQ
jgi:hypothetical protein